MEYANIITNFIIKSNDKYDLCYFKKKNVWINFFITIDWF